MTTTRIIPLPLHAVDAGEWQADGDDITRPFSGATRGTKVHVGTFGQQEYAGGVRGMRAIVEVGPGGGFLDAAELQQHIADCQAIFDELDSLSGPPAVVIELPA